MVLFKNFSLRAGINTLTVGIYPPFLHIPNVPVVVPGSCSGSAGLTYSFPVGSSA